MLTRRIIAAAVTTFALIQHPAAQTRSNTTRLFFTAGLDGASINSDELNQSNRSGPGLHIGGGWGFNSHFALFLDAAAANIDGGGDDYTLSHVDIGARYHFGASANALRPYLEASFTGRTAALDDQNVEGNDDVDIDLSGPAFTVGGGILYFFKPGWAFNAHAKWSFGTFSRVRVENITADGLDVDATSGRLAVGVSWFPGRRGTQ